jgi:hypothetical protein
LKQINENILLNPISESSSIFYLSKSISPDCTPLIFIEGLLKDEDVDYTLLGNSVRIHSNTEGVSVRAVYVTTSGSGLLNYVGLVFRTFDYNYEIVYPDYHEIKVVGESIEQVIARGGLKLNSHLDGLQKISGNLKPPRSYSEIVNDIVPNNLICLTVEGYSP